MGCSKSQAYQYKETNHQLNEMLLAAQANLNERDKLNRELKHQKNKVEEQHDTLLREKRRLDTVDEKLKAAQQQLMDERRQAGLRQDNNERQITENTIKIDELEEEATQYKLQLNKVKVERKELQRQHKEKDETIKDKDLEADDLQRLVDTHKRHAEVQEELAEKVRVREAEAIEKLNLRVASLEKELADQTAARASDQNGFSKQVILHKNISNAKFSRDSDLQTKAPLNALCVGAILTAQCCRGCCCCYGYELLASAPRGEGSTPACHARERHRE